MNRKLGNSDIEISAIGLGAWQFSEATSFHKFFWNGIDPETTEKIIDVSLKGGINWIDTAEIYGNGRSERGVSRALQSLKIDYPAVRIATKWNPLFRRAKSIVKTFPKRVENLSPYPITLHQVHNPASFSKPETEMEEMFKLLDDKRIEAVGVSNFNTKQMVRAFERLEELGYPMVSNQVKYSILDRRVDKELVDRAKELGVTIIAYSPLEQGLASGRFHENPSSLDSIPFIRKRVLKRKFEKSTELINEMSSIANNHGVTTSQVALNWLINYNGDTVVVIPGATKPTHAQLNAGAMNFKLSKEELSLLDDLSRQFI